MALRGERLREAELMLRHVAVVLGCIALATSAFATETVTYT